jgi:magnesium-transporting ATPase (P-type)
MNRSSKWFSLFLVWILFIAGCLSMLGSPIARYITGEMYYLWIMLGVSFVTLSLALIISKLVLWHRVRYDSI